MSDERREPFVAHVKACTSKGRPYTEVDGPAALLELRDNLVNADIVGRAVVVTPLLPGEPKPGDEMLLPDGRRVTVMGAVTPCAGEHVVVVRSKQGNEWCQTVEKLRPVPPEKTYRLKATHIGGWTGAEWTVVATSKEDALAQLADALEEVSE